MRFKSFGRHIKYRGLTIRESPFVYPVQPEVSEAVDLILGHLGGKPRQVLEVGSGSGIIACALSANGHSVVCTDIHSAAVRLTLENARANGLQLHAIQSDLFDHIAGRFDLIVFNVPNTIAVTALGTLLQYLGTRLLPKYWLEATADMLARQLARHSPKKQSLLERILAGAGKHLDASGSLILLAQEADLPHLVTNAHFQCISVVPLRNAERVRLVVLASRSPS